MSFEFKNGDRVMVKCGRLNGEIGTIKNSHTTLVATMHAVALEECRKTLWFWDYELVPLDSNKQVVDALKKRLNSIYGCPIIPDIKIKNVIFNPPATIVFWSDGTKTVVKAKESETYDSEKGLAMAISKKALGNRGNYYNTFSKWVPKDEVENEEDKIVELPKYCIDCKYCDFDIDETTCANCHNKSNWTPRI